MATNDKQASGREQGRQQSADMGPAGVYTVVVASSFSSSSSLRFSSLTRGTIAPPCRAVEPRFPGSPSS